MLLMQQNDARCLQERRNRPNWRDVQPAALLRRLCRNVLQPDLIQCPCVAVLADNGHELTGAKLHRLLNQGR